MPLPQSDACARQLLLRPHYLPNTKGGGTPDFAIQLLYILEQHFPGAHRGEPADEDDQWLLTRGEILGEHIGHYLAKLATTKGTTTTRKATASCRPTWSSNPRRTGGVTSKWPTSCKPPNNGEICRGQPHRAPTRRRADPDHQNASRPRLQPLQGGNIAAAARRRGKQPRRRSDGALESAVTSTTQGDEMDKEKIYRGRRAGQEPGLGSSPHHLERDPRSRPRCARRGGRRESAECGPGSQCRGLSRRTGPPGGCRQATGAATHIPRGRKAWEITAVAVGVMEESMEMGTVPPQSQAVI